VISLMGIAEDSPKADVKRMTKDEVNENNARYIGSVQKAKHHLSVCLKLLGIMYRNDDDCSDRSSEDRFSVWPGETRGDKLYLAMVMLNSALLKALHVADSFQLHCHREFPKIAATQDLQGDGEHLCRDGPRILEDGRICGQEYRRLQAECFVHLETAWSLEQQRDNDKARIRQLEEDIRQLRAKLKPKTPPQEVRPKPEPPEVAQLRDDGLALEWRADGSAFIPDDALQSFASVYQGLSQTVDEARIEASVAKQRADDAAKRANEARKEREDLQVLLSSGQGDLLDSARQLMTDLQHQEEQRQRRKENEQRASAMLAQLQELQLQDVALEQQCHDLSLENSRLQEAMAEGRRLASGLGDSLEAPPSGPRRGSASGARQRGLDIQEAESVTAELESGSRHTGRGYRSSAHGRSSSKPFVVCSNVRSHHSAAHGGSHRKRREEPQSQDRLFAKAALRYAKNPADPQALGKLASLLQKSAGHMGDFRLEEHETDTQDSHQARSDLSSGFPTSAAADEALQANVSQGDPRQAGRSPSPQSASRYAGQDVPSHRVLSLQLGKVRGVQSPYQSQNLSSRAFATPERRP